MGPKRVLLPVVAFLGLLFLAGLRLQLQLSACVRGGRPCAWLGGREEMAPREQDGKPPLLGSRLPLPRHGTLPPPRAPRCPGQGFQIGRLLAAFRGCVTPEGEILLQQYLAGWKELIKLIDALGAAFGLLARETQTKMAILEGHRSGPHAPHYHTLQAMVAFELRRGRVGLRVLPPDQPPSGSRTLLRLHRALKWLELFLGKLGRSGVEEDPSQLCAEAYQAALARYHGWWVRQAAELAFLALPSRRELYGLVCAEGEKEARAMLLDAVGTIARVYNITQQLYATHGLLELP
ncbi:glycolipid transfer protein domain-containing protein 2 isoform X2 [Malaclemys terrapin pileata]|uniref:glycolipid transfer protein domain-containing protein 2 isoform X2 n=1 Tax=Malaclemys terrapin pileata TaxID=2991368 RepID=UPI0023A8AD70|nr:glycolipid transfer protein domain-containing protein 2 isoform X2 [Malaclemys terrapin pileata]